ncbi:NADH dehydrogenase [ubiquinone] iron-sulfur protein 5 [Melanaphis sacchari]|uniref:NADH dehydrogenase [ubiquinone] iron-sulfur protein 5 n=1 Tax=Melanaphis sacchari TaxID=742174 RepID=UPI000DC1409A|nr:NADH dehydrogenase [ubiquinone] iron-sulfur protein 5 [Melanaphis sacchari]
MAFLSPFFRNPITDFTGPLMSAQTGVRCADFEMKLMNCYEAYGYPKGIEVCQAYYEDFKECCTREKQMSRIVAIQNERERQAKPEYEKPPAMHTF